MTLLVNKNRAAFPTFANEFFGRDFPGMFFDSHTELSVPSVNIVENGNEFQIEMAAPGLTKKDFKIEVNKTVLTISSEKEVSNEEVKEKYVQREFSYDSFKRSFRLSKSVKTEEIKATYDNGILRVVIPKMEDAIDKGPIQVNID